MGRERELQHWGKGEPGQEERGEGWDGKENRHAVKLKLIKSASYILHYY